jgi:ABC-2 type transport system permease protein
MKEISMQQDSLSRVSPGSYLRAILAIAKKDWLHFIRYPFNAVLRIIEPIIWLVPVYFLGVSFATDGRNTGFAAYAGTEDYMSFVLLGTVLSSYIGAVFWGMGFALKTEMDTGVLESNWLAPMARPVLLVGRTLASVTITTVNSAGMLLLAWWFFGFHVTGSLLSALGVVIPMLVALYGFGFAFAALVLLVREPNTMVDVSNFVVSLLAGSRFPVTVLPRVLLPVALALPLTYGFDAVRGILLQSTTILPIGVEILILVLFMFVMVPLGYGVFRLVERRSRRLGTLGLH